MHHASFVSFLLHATTDVVLVLFLFHTCVRQARLLPVTRQLLFFFPKVATGFCFLFMHAFTLPSFENFPNGWALPPAFSLQHTLIWFSPPPPKGPTTFVFLFSSRPYVFGRQLFFLSTTFFSSH
jgi:hypothetical protein